MGCGACAAGLSRALPRRVSSKQIQVDTECEYTLETMYLWLEKLNCIKQQNLFSELGITKYKINFAIGDVQSAINTGTVCMFKARLDKVNDIILALINLGKC